MTRWVRCGIERLIPIGDTKSLRTSDKDQASVLAALFEAQTRRLFLTLKRHGERMKVEQIEALVHHWLEGLDYFFWA